VTLRYRKLKIIVPMIITSMSEVLILFGASVAIGWTIDLASVAGILAIVGTGVDAQIILIDQTLRGGSEQLTMKERIKRALFMIFGAGGTAIGAMLPLMILGFGLLRGFALTTIVGVILGIFIIRPAFGEIIKLIMQGKQTTV
jgi:preprotein translocase subunit SecD